MVLTAMGSVINKCITVAEILKRRVAGLHQWNQIKSIMLEVLLPCSHALCRPRRKDGPAGTAPVPWRGGPGRPATGERAAASADAGSAYVAEASGQPAGLTYDHHALART